jgi:NAD(P)-dependent dehydrogenase (short-subunit alcohol dehydrogenase family)
MTGWVLITGSSRRIGRAIALELAQHGWDIVIHYHQSSTEAQALANDIRVLGRDACLAEIDLSNPSLAQRLIPSLADEIGMIDALVNNAALFEPDTMDPGGSRHWAINAEAPRLLSKAFRDHLPKSERAAIVNMLDSSPTPPEFSAYAKSKAFLTELTLNMAKSFAPQVRINGVAPSFVLPSPRQSLDSFTKMANNRIVSVKRVADAVRRLIEDPTTSGKVHTIDANDP